ncbi:unnamed protein product [Rotaria socialis]|uniref:Uncharacterized protein n=1 Tax=Rotaria socialis TaxID=392032 RepID=A0A818WSL5_9BILA|nr:unnamed protein product [Rotaria socialis]CAF4774882.1 unnamed protein product [Rotaria socialis]
MEESILSQKMTELTTTTTTTINDVIIKNNSSLSIDKTIQDRLEIIPSYLKEENKIFQSIIDQVLCLMNISSIGRDNICNDLQHISILMYKMHILSIYHSLWTTYWKSGLGQLIKQQKNYVFYSTNISIWPKEIKRIIITTMNEQHTDTYTSSMDLVCYHRQELERQLRQIQIQWNEKVNHLSGYNLKVEQLLQDYIIQNQDEFQKEIEHKIELVTYDYHIEAIKQEFNRQNSTEYQKKLMKQLYLKKDEKETTEQELKFLQERIDHFNASDQSFEHSTIIESTAMIDSIENIEIRQQLQQQWRKIIQQAKADFCILILETAEEQRSTAALNYDNHANKLYSIHHNALDFTTLPLKMIDLIHEYCRMIGERIQSIYKYKIECFRLKLNKIQHHY